MNKTAKIIIATSFILMALGLTAVILAQPNTARAQETPAATLSIPKPSTLPGPSEKTQEGEKIGGEYTVTKILPGITKALMAFAGISCFIFLVISGIRFMIAYGDTEAITGAKKQAQWAVIGLLISILGYAIVSIISSLTF